ncbi:UDP-N-acetylmuramoyl-L-alanyl-D-glutamate--2,6-diaminopimelate ligase [Motiliproteus coralliicola]|uniref:UDP-N-acetylmuramoyl-L-alanyl-D-glutamate--2,6-diaminopimelate ligase n=1 Tax=Motiliproteus coralliicola TaxID=2283196 RepID=A0A369WM83_9GAMM|nr:UDP-N-acetylmuramoyl-L-alanyl-D-glutamate--2,6-diaminopimelate ligase [Motiliproteus coralliicola]RDE22787.1 UDP-N-acetylmuramoyl-L-alanyl-D-glutamate--2,6-diaminopimelate ligase [Motiliproteus coralliicola]
MNSSCSLTLQQLLPDLVLPPEVAEQPITGIENDSRRIQGGDLFLACRGLSVDGNRFAEAAVAAGAVAVLTEDDEALTALSVPVIRVDSLTAKQGELAARFFGNPSRKLHMIGITGTNGKTSCSHFVAAALERFGQRAAVIGTTGNGFLGSLEPATHTTPDAVQLQRLLADLVQQQAGAVAMEVSSHALEQGRVSGVAFEQAVFTNLSRDHLDYHGSMEAYGEAKARLLLEYPIRHAVINSDDPFGRALIERIPSEVDVLAYGEQPLGSALQARALPLQVLNCQLHRGGIRAQIDSPWGEAVIDSPLLGRFNLDNLLAALGVLLGAGIEIQTAVAALNQLDGVEGRMQAFDQPDQPLVVVDYAHTPDALDKALSSLREHAQGRLWCVFGCGGDRDRGKRPQMAAAAEKQADHLMVTSDNPRSEAPQAIIDEVMGGIQKPGSVRTEVDRPTAIARAIEEAAPEDVILVAGKGHEDYQEINGVRHRYSDIETVKQILGMADAL